MPILTSTPRGPTYLTNGTFIFRNKKYLHSCQYTDQCTVNGLGYVAV